MCLNPVYLDNNRKKYPLGFKVPCGKCVQCRIQKRTEWTVRMLHESEFWKKKSFITLTYNDESLPENNSLRKTDLQKFFKRLRKRLDGRKIKYFACGEYGEKYQRPHMHAIIFGVGLDNDDIDSVIDSWKLSDWNESIKRHAFGLVESDSIRYVAQYIDKKLSGPLVDLEYTRTGREPPFRLLSHGMGLPYVEKYKNTFDKGYITINGYRKTLPRYYINKSEIDIDKIQNRQKEFEKEKIEKLTGKYLSSDDLYLTDCDGYVLVEEREVKERIQNDKNLKAKLRRKQRSSF